MDNQSEDDIKRLVDFLLEINLDIAEFTVLTPFPHTKAYNDFKQNNRIFSFNWDDYSADKVVFHPKQMSAQRLQVMLDYAWDTFYQDEPQEIKMFKLFKKVVHKEMTNNTYQKRERSRSAVKFGQLPLSNA